MASHEAIVPIVLAIFYGALAAASYAGLGYFKTTAGDPQKFVHLKFLSTVLLGLTLGGIGGAIGWAPATVEQWFAGMGLLAGLLIGIEWLAKGILRRMRPNGGISSDTGGQMGVVSIVALLTAIPSTIVAYALFLVFVGGNGFILGTGLAAVAIIVTKILIDAKNGKKGK